MCTCRLALSHYMKYDPEIHSLQQTQMNSLHAFSCSFSSLVSRSTIQIILCSYSVATTFRSSIDAM